MTSRGNRKPANTEDEPGDVTTSVSRRSRSGNATVPVPDHAELVSTLGLRSLGLGSAIPDVIVGCCWLAVWWRCCHGCSHRARGATGDLRCLEFYHGR